MAARLGSTLRLAWDWCPEQGSRDSQRMFLSVSQSVG